MSTDSPDTPDIPRPIGEIAQGPSAFEQFLDRNQKNLVILTILLAVAAAALVVYRGVSSSKEHTAGAELSKAEDLAALRSVIKEHAGTAAADSAEVLLAARQWSDGQQDPAIETLKAFIAAKPKHPARPTAQASLGSKLQTLGKMADASKVFQELADDPAARFLAPYALISLGDIAKTGGSTEQAEKFYQRAKNEFPDSSFSNIVSKRIALLKAQMPAEIDAPPPPPATPATPTTPGAPTTPAVPGAVTPTTPAAPTIPVPPVTPEAPGAAAPTLPVPPAAPAIPAPPVAPEAPAPVQETPAAPRSGPDTQAPPAAPASPSKP